MAGLNRTLVLKVLGFALTLFGFLLNTLGLSTDYWAEAQADHNAYSVKLHYGLIHIHSCRSDYQGVRCASGRLSSLSGLELGYFHGCLAAMCLAFFCNVVATFCMGPWIAKVGPKWLHTATHITTLVALCFAAFWMCIAVGVFGAKDEEALLNEESQLDPFISIDHQFGWSWGLTILAVFVELAAVFAVLFARPTEELIRG